MTGRKGKEKVVVDKEIHSEDWCFICKDGGNLRICDYKHCLKSYHPKCVEEDESFLESESRWICNWHTCFNCHRSSYRHCYTCPTSVCRHCLPATKFAQIKGKYGFCDHCLVFALLIEENKDCDSDGDMVDFTDRETCEGLFMEYYMIIKKEEGFESGDVFAAHARIKMKKNRQSGSGSEDFDDDDDDEENVSDFEHQKNHKRRRKEKRSDKQKPTVPTQMKSYKMEFAGWASSSLMEFLSSVGKGSSEALSQHAVTSIVNMYIKENKLSHPKKRKIVICDTRLKSLFGRSTINRNRIYDLLKVHFVENQEPSDEEELEYDYEDNDASTLILHKKQKKLEKKSEKKELEVMVPQSGYASIVVENVKLVYLTRSLIYELLKQPESFNEKVVGCFVRIKSDPYDYTSRNSHQLMQVKGVKTVSPDVNNSAVVLLFSAMPKEIHINLLSDGDFSKEECEDLRQKVQNGLLERPTVVELQQKAKNLHSIITKQWISKELRRLQKRIDQANEKGWRFELGEYLEKKKMLEKPEEQERLLKSIPTVIPDIPEPNHESEDTGNASENDQSSPKSILQCNSTVQGDDVLQSDKTQEEEEVTPHCHASLPERKQKSASEELRQGQIHHVEEKKEDLETGHFEKEPSMKSEEAHQDKQAVKESLKPSRAEVVDLLSDGDDENAHNDSKGHPVRTAQEVENLESETWCILGPNGERDKCSMNMLKRWHETCKYASEFKVWREDQTEETAVCLREAIKIVFPGN